MRGVIKDYVGLAINRRKIKHGYIGTFRIVKWKKTKVFKTQVGLVKESWVNARGNYTILVKGIDTPLEALKYNGERFANFIVVNKQPVILEFLEHREQERMKWVKL